MESCTTCGEPLDDDGLCGVCLFANVLDGGAVLPERIGGYRILRLVGRRRNGRGL